MDWLSLIQKKKALDGENGNENKIHCRIVLCDTGDDEIVSSSPSFLALHFILLVRSLFIPKDTIDSIKT